MPHIINMTAVAAVFIIFGCGELNGRMLKLAMNKKPRNLKLPSMQRSDLVLEECVELVILI